MHASAEQQGGARVPEVVEAYVRQAQTPQKCEVGKELSISHTAVRKLQVRAEGALRAELYAPAPQRPDGSAEASWAARVQMQAGWQARTGVFCFSGLSGEPGCYVSVNRLLIPSQTSKPQTLAALCNRG